MNNYYSNWQKVLKEEMTTKILYILRGISGSGKSTKAKDLVNKDMTKVFSTDDYFMKDGKYIFNPREIPTAHEWNRKRVEQALIQGIGPIVVDNTNTELWEAKPYANLAQRYGHEVKFVESEAPWRFDADELAKRNVHGVPKASIDKMIKRYVPHDQYTLDNVLKSKSPWEK